MDYKKKYEEAMLRMNKWVEGSEIIEPKEVAEYIFPELKESDDERIRKYLINYVKSAGVGHSLFDSVNTRENILAWLEKPKYTEEDLNNAYKCADEVQYRRGYEDAKKEIEKQCEQKPTDKIEPKFKVGDWVTNGIDFTFKVMSIKDDMYYRDDNYFIDIKTADKTFRLWTIQDAKDGDVLIDCCDDYKNPLIFILKKFETVDFGLVRKSDYSSYCFLSMSDKPRFKEGYFHHMNDIKPATKEQRALLFSKMKEAGYEWDAKKKELKMAESVQPELPNGEDYGVDSLYHAERILEKTLGEVDGYQSDDGTLEHKCAIEAVNRLYKQKPTWSEEDEKMLKSVISSIRISRSSCEEDDDVRDLFDNEISWLESIKERMKGE